ncbi:hypothetical protein [Aquimarina mytili]|uniref:Uncharacterized protein n=1 Tax=Aquimarina mytili TaxID=874423 RepID=A0A937A3J6_9FLAO|nr:hypothetical protein [Aquimarina mytili]MBL0684305.1 hypothetical protein [Aquimarina mytili]
MSKSYEKVVLDFEKAVLQMQDDLQYLADKDSLSTGFFNKQNRIIRSIIDYYQRTQTYIEHLEREALEQHRIKRLQIQKYEDWIISFEAICVIHGILDFPIWLHKGKKILIYEAEQLGKEKQMRLPDLFKDKLKQLSEKEHTMVMDILEKKGNEEIRKLLRRINKRKGNEQYVIRS